MVFTDISIVNKGKWNVISYISESSCKRQTAYIDLECKGKSGNVYYPNQSNRIEPGNIYPKLHVL